MQPQLKFRSLAFYSISFQSDEKKDTFLFLQAVLERGTKMLHWPSRVYAALTLLGK